MGNLTKNFSKREFACKCGCGFNNISTTLVNLCQKIRDEVKQPLYINSGCRCIEHNKRVGGVKHSYHTKGLAVDLSLRQNNARFLYETIINMFHNGEIPELSYCLLYVKRNFVHIDIGKRRKFMFDER